ncbi:MULTISPECIES: pPIWI-associating nuclease domain-containing protein [Methylobacteriaceae]|uniref:pPIWI-associating nuclease domain-containing protein n=1 Tax=Methylobacteriaceae TaxID=119045 RepID=UPI0011717159|nr:MULTISPECIES: hypothetical protein [Methylobacteriaceae]GEL42916.1 hypothetical protein MEX01_35070 [Methylorubrum extorquens]
MNSPTPINAGSAARLPEEVLRGLKPLAPDEFSRQLLDSAASVIEDQGNFLRLNYFSVAVRVFFEHIMGTLSPDDQVSSCPWFQLEDGQDKPTRAQRIKYWLQGGLTDDYLVAELSLDPAPLRKRLMKAFSRLSKHVHVRENTVVYEPAIQATEIDQATLAVEELLLAYRDCRNALLEPLAEALDEEAVDTLMSETIGDIDELATHHSLEEVYTADTCVLDIGPRFVRYQASGTVSVLLQYGSNSDVRRGDGAEMSTSFPFAVEFEVPLEEPRDLRNAHIVSGVDTASWFDVPDDEDLPDVADDADSPF